MNKKDFTRRRFIATVSAGSVVAMASGAVPFIGKTGSAGKLAALGGKPVRAPEKVFPSWPYI